MTEEVKEDIEKYLETNENGNTMIQNLWDAAKAVLRRKFIVIQVHFRKQEKSQNKQTEQSNFTPKGTRERGANKTQS